MSTGNGFGTDNEWGTRTAAYNTNFKSYQLADLNGDGLPDLIYIDSSKQIHVLINTGSGFGPDATISGFTVDLDIAGMGFQMADVDGDGVPDLVYDSNNTFWVIQGDGNRLFARNFLLCAQIYRVLREEVSRGRLEWGRPRRYPL